MEINSTLIIDDSHGDRLLIENVLIEHNPRIFIDKASNYFTALDFLKERKYDLLIIDLNMPGKGGVEFVLDTDNKIDSKKFVLTGAALNAPLKNIISDKVDKFILKDTGMRNLANALVALKRHSA